MKPAALGITKFEDIVNENVFYVDKTYFIREWLAGSDRVTLVTRPRRFGKTLTLNMVETFFSKAYEGRSDLFERFDVWKDEKLRTMQGQYPVINLSFADVKQDSYESMTAKMKRIISTLYKRHRYLLDSDKLSKDDKAVFTAYLERKATDEECMESLLRLSEYMHIHFEKPVIILMDEYDTPMLEAYTAGYWDKAIVYIRRMFHATYKDNPNLFRGLMTGITRITQESVFSDLNNVAVVTTTTELFETSFGFTEDEVHDALREYGLYEKKDEVRRWYDGFRFGRRSDIYNPWSIINFLKFGKFEPYWMNTSGNGLVGKLLREGSVDVKNDFENLLNGGTICSEIDEAITYAELSGASKSIWSWLVTTGYIKIVSEQTPCYELALTNYEVRLAFEKLVKKWFDGSYDNYKGLMRKLLEGDLESLQYYMEKVTRQTFSFFDVGNESTETERTEQFYHGFTLGLIADLNNTHVVTSNRESGFGRYDVCIEPNDVSKDGIIIEFKIFDPKKEKTLEETARRALKQIEDRKYETALKAKGIKTVRRYGFAFKGKEVLIMEADEEKRQI